MSQIPRGPWHTNPEAWDSAVIDGKTWPGIATINFKRANKWDTPKAQGSHGAPRKFKGVDLGTGSIEIVYWTQEQHDEIVTLLADLEPEPGKTEPKSHRIGHAVATVRKLKDFTVDDIDGPKVKAGIGTFVIGITEHREPTTNKATGTVKGSAGGNSGTAKNAAYCQARQAEIDFLQIPLAEATARWEFYNSFATYDANLADAARADMEGYLAQIANIKNAMLYSGCTQCGPKPATASQRADFFKEPSQVSSTEVPEDPPT